MNETQAFQYLANIFGKDNCTPYYSNNLWVHLSHFLEIAPEKAIEYGFFELLHGRILRRMPRYYDLNMKCYALLVRCEEGQKRFDNADGISLLYAILNGEYLDTNEYVVLALLHGMISKRALKCCCKFSNLPDILTRLARKRRYNLNRQLYCLKALRLLGQIPTLKDYIRSHCYEKLKLIKCHNECNECTRDELIQWLDKEIYDADINN